MLLTEPAPTNLADALNHGCRCQTLDTAQLQRELGRDAGLRDVAGTLAQTHPRVGLVQLRAGASTSRPNSPCLPSCSSAMAYRP